MPTALTDIAHMVRRRRRSHPGGGGVEAHPTEDAFTVSMAFKVTVKQDSKPAFLYFRTSGYDKLGRQIFRTLSQHGAHNE